MCWKWHWGSLHQNRKHWSRNKKHSISDRSDEFYTGNGESESTNNEESQLQQTHNQLLWPVILVFMIILTTWSPIGGTYAQLACFIGLLIGFLFAHVDWTLCNCLKCSGIGVTFFKKCFFILCFLVWVHGLVVILYTEGISRFLWSLCLVLAPFVLWFVFFCFYILWFFWPRLDKIWDCEVAQI